MSIQCSSRRKKMLAQLERKTLTPFEVKSLLRKHHETHIFLRAVGEGSAPSQSKKGEPNPKLEKGCSSADDNDEQSWPPI